MGGQVIKRIIFFGVASLIACTDSALTGDFRTSNGVRVNPVNAQVFEVIARPGDLQVLDFWCGAGEYARRVLDAPGRARVYVVSEAGPGAVSDSKSTVQFSLSPPEQTQGALGHTSYWGPNIGSQASVVEAGSRCRTQLRFDD